MSRMSRDTRIGLTYIAGAVLLLAVAAVVVYLLMVWYGSGVAPPAGDVPPAGD